MISLAINMDIGLLYGVAAAVCVIVIMVVRNRVKATDFKEMIDGPFVFLLTFFAIFCLADAIWGLLTSRCNWDVPRFPYVLSTYLFHFLSGWAAFFWAGYVMKHVGMPKKDALIINIIRTVLLVTQLVFLLSNLWTGKLFTFDEEVVYHSYAPRRLLFVFQFSYYLILIIYGIIGFFRTKTAEEHQTYKQVILYSAVPFLFGFGQMLWTDAPMYSLGFLVTAVLIYSFNITAQREQFLEKSLKEENNKLNAIINALSEDVQSIYYINTRNGWYEKFTDDSSDSGDILVKTYTGADFFSERLDEMRETVNPEDYSYFEELLDQERIIQELEDRRSFSFNYRRLAPEGEHTHFMLKAVRSQVAGEEDRVIIGIFDDEERSRAEAQRQEELERAREEAERANQAKSNFLFSMSHDIRTPMNAILGFTDLAKKHMDNRLYLGDCLNKVSASGAHLLALINDVLDMSRIESGKMKITEKPESMDEMNKQVVSIIQELAVAKSIRFTPDFERIRDRFISCDRLHLNQIILNVLSNSVKYTKPGGAVDYTVEQLEDPDPQHALYRFTVRDTGIGMSPEFVKHIFEEFEREQTATISGVEGTGLGMSIVKRLVDMMNGTIEVESTQDVGTTTRFVIAFEKADETQVEQEEETVAEIEPFAEKKRVLLVDDNELNREIGRELLEEMGLEVEEAADGVEAVDKVQTLGADHYDVILMDVQMPIMDGYAATRAIRTLRGCDQFTLPIFAMTANAFEDDKINAFKAGMNEHLAKPINTQELYSALKRYIG